MNALMIALHQKPVTVTCWFLVPLMAFVWVVTAEGGVLAWFGL